MKKLISLVLCLMLALPAFALAESTTVDFGTFAMDLGPNDRYEVADTMTDSQLYAIIYPEYNPQATFTNTINVVWSARDLAAEIKSVGGMTQYAQVVLKSAKQQYNASGISMANPAVLNAEMDDNVAASLATYTLDYTGAGVDLVLDLYQMQVIYFNGTAGSYIFTLTAPTKGEVQALSAYLDALTFKTEKPTTASATSSTVDFGAFTMTVSSNDYYEVADAMTSNAVYLMLYPDYFLTGSTTNNINVVYTEDNLALQLLLVGGIEKYAELMLQQAAAQYDSMGIKMSDAQVLYAAKEDDKAAIIISSNLDYSGAGIDLTLTLYQMTGMFMKTSAGDYIFTLTADSMDKLSEMTDYLDSVQFK